MVRNYTLFGLLLLYVSSSANALPEPYRSIKVLRKDLHGWFKPENRKNLTYFIKTYNPKIVVELGSWLGLSTIHMASLMSPGSTLYAIDNWTAQGDVTIQAAIQSNKEIKAKIPILYQQFLSNVIHHRLAHRIVPLRMDTVEAAQALKIRPNLLYIDASHDEQSVFKDIMNWYPKLAPKAIICGDDWEYWPGVQQAVKKAAVLLKRVVKSEGNFWYFEPYT
jgi:hypothetical protein